MSDEQSESLEALNPAAYLQDLAERLRRVPVMYGTDDGDVDRLLEIVELFSPVLAETRVTCSGCGKPVSSPLIPIGELVVRAFVECPECIERRPGEPKV